MPEDAKMHFSRYVIEEHPTTNDSAATHIKL
jgi:hypothetical protein